MLTHTVHNLEKRVYIHYHLDDSLSDIRRLSARTKCPARVPIQKALFADDCPLMAHKDTDLQMMLDRFSDTSKLSSSLA